MKSPWLHTAFDRLKLWSLLLTVSSTLLLTAAAAAAALPFPIFVCFFVIDGGEERRGGRFSLGPFQVLLLGRVKN